MELAKATTNLPPQTEYLFLKYRMLKKQFKKMKKKKFVMEII